MAKLSLQSSLGEFAVCSFALVKKVNLLRLKFGWFLLFQPFVASDETCKSVNVLNFFVSKSVKCTCLHVFHVNLFPCILSQIMVLNLLSCSVYDAFCCLNLFRCLLLNLLSFFAYQSLQILNRQFSVSIQIEVGERKSICL